LGGGWAAAAGGLASGFLLGWLVRVWHVAVEDWRVLPASIGLCTGVGALAALTLASGEASWWGPAAAAVLSAAAAAWLERQRARGSVVRTGTRCFSCREWLPAVGLECPRCGTTVCDRPECWSHEGCRCRRCEATGVAALPDDPRWWDKVFGGRQAHGQCQMCLTESGQTDLRACGKCGRRQCRGCWDHTNGQCRYCRWVAPELPARLSRYMRSGPGTGVY
jgi:hypothetical protein